jgi:fumarate reductase subunit D
MARSNEPLVWALFFAGAGIAALLMPVTIFLTSLAIWPLGWIDEHRLAHLLESPWVRLYLFILITLSLFHALHRIRFILVDFGLKSVRGPVAFLCYACAIVGTAFAAWFVLPVWS